MSDSNTRLLAIPDREHAAWLGDVEQRVVLPLKWVMLLLCVSYWLWLRDWNPPAPEAFALFVSYAMLTIGEQYFFVADRITPRQVTPFVYGSFLIDGLFVTGLVILEITEFGGLSDYTALYVLLVIRGFALFRTRLDNIVGFGLVSALFLFAAYRQLMDVSPVDYLQAQGRLCFIWGMMLISQAFVGLVNRQRHEEMRARERMLRSSSLGSLGDLAAGVAHEINNPIGIIKTYADYLMQTTGKDEGLQDDFLTIRNEASRCQEIVRRMLDFSNPKMEPFSEIDLENLVSEVASFVFHEGHGEQVTYEIVASDRLPKVLGDAVQLKQAVINVTMNARQILGEFSTSGNAPEGFIPKVTMTLGRASGPRPPIRLSLRDNGPGIDKDDAEKIFEPFYTRRAKGTGLGMAITRRIVDAHNGRITIAPHRDGGTEVIMEIPMAGEEES